MNSIKERFDSMDGTKSEAVQKIQERFQPMFLNIDRNKTFGQRLEFFSQNALDFTRPSILDEDLSY